MFNKLKKVIAFALIMGALASSASAAELSSWAKDDYINANRARLIPFSVGSKSMGDNITREQLCELIVNAYEKISGKEIPTYEKKPFTDCENQTVINAYGEGLVGGTGKDTFSPENLVTRQEMAKMIYNMLVATELDIKFSTSEDTGLNNYSDAEQISSWAKPAMATALNYSLINGSDGLLLPSQYTTCEQAIVAVIRACNAFGTEETTSITQTPSIITPKETETIAEKDVSVAWTPVSGGVIYKVLVRDNNGELVVNTETNDTSAILPRSNFDTGLYHITVSAVMGNGEEIFSVPETFSYVCPPQPVLVNGGLQSFDAPDKQSDVQAFSGESPVVTGIFAEAEKYIGTPYRYGGTTPSGFDCSGYVQYVFRANGITLKRTSRDQYANNGYSVSKSELKRGDLVFFGSGSVNHVGIYAGNGMMIHSPSTGKTVTYTSIETDYYKSHYIGAKRIID